MTKPLLAAMAMTIALILPGMVSAQTPGTLYTQGLAATCANCHGTNGKAVESSSVTSLAGLDRNFFVTQMKAFKEGTRPATIMHQISKGFSDAQVQSLAAYFAAQKK